MAESAASLIPASVPRPAAKLAVLGVGGLIAFWLLQKVRSLPWRVTTGSRICLAFCSKLCVEVLVFYQQSLR